MLSTKLTPYIYLVDLKPAGLSQFIASYIIKAKKIAIIETGPAVTVPNLLSGLEEIKVKKEDVDFVLVSHIHLDHSGGAGSLLNYLPNAKLVVHRRGVPHIVNPQKLWMQSKQVLSEIAELYKAPVPVESKRIIVAEDTMAFNLGNSVELRVVETLGHASHHQSFYEKRSQGIFTGDTLGVYIHSFDALIPTTPPPFHLETTLASIRKLKQLKPRCLFYSHFGQDLRASEKLQMYDGQLRLWASIIAKKMRENATLKEIREEIEKHDPQMRKVSTHIRTHPIINKGTIPQSIQGFMGYFNHINERD